MPVLILRGNNTIFNALNLVVWSVVIQNVGYWMGLIDLIFIKYLTNNYGQGIKESMLSSVDSNNYLIDMLFTKLK